MIGKQRREAGNKKKKRQQRTTKTQEERGTTDEQKSRHAELAAKGKKEAMERMAKAKEALEFRKKGSKDGRQSKGKDNVSEEEEFNNAVLLDNLTYQVSLDDMEKILGIQIIPEDRVRLDRQLIKKMREPTVRALLQGAKEEDLTLAMLPRLPRFIRQGQLFKVTGANLVRSYPQLFENVQQVVLKLRSETFFLQESPKLNWAIITTEVLPDSREKTYMQQRQTLLHHAQRYQANERRVRGAI